MNTPDSFLRDIWYYALPGEQLKPGQMLAKTILHEQLLLGRDRSGQVFALRDICPHRAVPLSCGRFDGLEIECCYHGWRFNSAGECTLISSLTADRPVSLQRYNVRKYHVHEVQGNMWIYLPNEQRPESIPDREPPCLPGFGDVLPQASLKLKFPCHINQVLRGLRDPAHVPYLQRVGWWWRLIGNTPKVEISLPLPGIQIEQISIGKQRVCNLTLVTPLTESETEVTTLFYTTLPWVGIFQPIVMPLIRTFLDRDRQMAIEHQLC